MISMRRTLAIAALMMAAAVPSDARIGRDPAADIPPVLFTTLPQVDPSYPTFVAASAAISSDGKIDSDLFHPHAVRSLESLLAVESATGCNELGPVYWELTNVPDRSTLRLAARTSQLTLVGRVVEREYGFHFFEAGQLLSIEVEEVIRGDAPLDRYYYFHPIGDFQAGPYRICKSDSRYPEPPAIGDRVLLMVPRPVTDPSEPYLELETPEGVVVLAADGEIRLPDRFRPQKEEGVSLSTAPALVETVRSESARPEEEK
jgi:hypothetical protein